jgi:hypothetical protein
MDYCNGVQGFVNYALSNLRNISRDGIRCSCKNKKKIYWSKCCNNKCSKKKRLIEKYICWYAHKEPYVPYDTMVE